MTVALEKLNTACKLIGTYSSHSLLDCCVLTHIIDNFPSPLVLSFFFAYFMLISNDQAVTLPRCACNSTPTGQSARSHSSARPAPVLLHFRVPAEPPAVGRHLRGGVRITDVGRVRVGSMERNVRRAGEELSRESPVEVDDVTVL
jgi:hypothetical protein